MFAVNLFATATQYFHSTFWFVMIYHQIVFGCKRVINFIYIYIHIYICNRVYCIHISGHDPLTFSFPFLFLFDWVGVLWPQLSKVLKPVRWPAVSLFPQGSCRGRLFVCCCGRCSCVHLRGEPVSSYFSMACYSIVSY